MSTLHRLLLQSAENFFVFLMVRVLYFIGAFFCLASGSAIILGQLSPRRLSAGDADSILSNAGWMPASLLFSSKFWLIICTLAFLIALFGPGYVQRKRNRGRGELQRLRASSVYHDTWRRSHGRSYTRDIIGRGINGGDGEEGIETRLG